ncbi:DUF4349 domain-containing protein [Yinghuangia seranimata]|uniref:DUF4349 domain-containing protein n=1 Tax=Yinghuangia seranimata TaxID=408067 RepID=UPI00248B044E|nr:DUF4349 domain-containing protein [Yinghuangia seranimata]MDI2125120.1 DUF4349 domain-containing protein [Yinghuangia seranimata]
MLTADLRIEADSPEQAAASARSLVAGVNGLIAGEQTTRVPVTAKRDGKSATAEPSGGAGDAEWSTSTTLTLKVPPGQFDKVLDGLSALGTVTARNRGATDITDQVVDVASRVETQRRSVERVRDLLAKATSLGEIVSLESELTKRESDLEALLKRQESLSAQSDLSTITLRVDPRPAPAAPAKAKESDDDGFGDSVLGALKAGWHGLVVTVEVLLVVVAAVLPFGLLAFALWFLHRRLGRPLARVVAAWRTTRAAAAAKVEADPVYRWGPVPAARPAAQPAAAPSAAPAASAAPAPPSEPPSASKSPGVEPEDD